MKHFYLVASVMLLAVSGTKPESEDLMVNFGVFGPDLPPLPVFGDPGLNLMMPNDPRHGYGGYGGYGPQRGSCRDKEPYFCQGALDRGRCNRRKVSRKCKKTCGLCEDETECEDTGFSCFMASEYLCEQSWFTSECKKSCNKCTTKTTQAPITTQEPEEECIDVSFNCRSANKYRCALFWFSSVCEKSCGICTPGSTTQAPITTQRPEEECTDVSFNCGAANIYRCALFWFKSGCKKSCGICTSETTTAITTAVTEEGITTKGPTATASSTIPTHTTEYPSPPTTETTSTSPEISPTDCANATKSTTRLTTTLSTALPIHTTEIPSPPTTETTSKEVSPTDSEKETKLTTSAEECVDSTPIECHTWESLGLCYNPLFEEKMKQSCPLSCGVCTP